MPRCKGGKGSGGRGSERRWSQSPVSTGVVVFTCQGWASGAHGRNSKMQIHTENFLRRNNTDAQALSPPLKSQNKADIHVKAENTNNKIMLTAWTEHGQTHF